MVRSEVLHAKRVLHEVATQTFNLGMGLQNAAPPEAKLGGSIQYLKDISEKLNSVCGEIDELISTNPK